MKFLFSLLSVSFLGLTLSGLFARLHLQDDTTFEEHRRHWTPRCECGCGGEGEECDFFDSDTL